MILTVLDNMIRTKWTSKIVKLSRATNYNKVRSAAEEEGWVTVKLKKRMTAEITLQLLKKQRFKTDNMYIFCLFFNSTF